MLYVFNKILLMLHFIGLAMGLSVPFANIIMAALMSKAQAPEKAVLGRFPLAMSKVGKIGLALLWATGITMVFTRWSGFSTLPRTFMFKLTAVVLLTITVGYISLLETRVKKGDMAALARIQTAGKIAFALGITAIIFAVLTFN
ncbi:MAG TPA: hypothetical protein VJS69_13285 [Candidatus Krumholzibacteria bacterium]|nr:hypothetical protein [Candidatus Krumholzibacteria bacterium]